MVENFMVIIVLDQCWRHQKFVAARLGRALLVLYFRRASKARLFKIFLISMYKCSHKKKINLSVRLHIYYVLFDTFILDYVVYVVLLLSLIFLVILLIVYKIFLVKRKYTSSKFISHNSVKSLLLLQYKYEMETSKKFFGKLNLTRFPQIQFQIFTILIILLKSVVYLISFNFLSRNNQDSSILFYNDCYFFRICRIFFQQVQKRIPIPTPIILVLVFMVVGFLFKGEIILSQVKVNREFFLF
eukprot:TRINITY_DN647_c0_g1_i1.p2 TRINITY_DN647_c0_g1~~TRINITY_DN647_c0_g1_i1.p2  ORF type:complete len:243 (-),score=-10.65 TRINITY_DN647_c0_g1_i1:1043-1771(-)